MEIKTSIESLRDITIDIFNAGRLAVASIIARIDERMCDYGNSEDKSL